MSKFDAKGSRLLKSGESFLIPHLSYTRFFLTTSIYTSLVIPYSEARIWTPLVLQGNE
ncbi:hypothetical protein VCHA29O37_250001 [Vibrio chagasii]|nr:hypothetical protein VCHA29O37_250001 [Vibrio chagasii]